MRTTFKELRVTPDATTVWISETTANNKAESHTENELRGAFC